jgi:hypothetical protein
MKNLKSAIVRHGKNVVKGVSAVAIAVAVTAGTAAAEIPVGVTELSTGDVDTIMGFVIVALATMWAYRKVVKTMNRS